MKIYRYAAFAALLLSSAVCVFSQNAVDKLLSSRGITPVSSDSAAGKTVSVYAFPSGLRFSVESSGPVDADAVDSALNLIDQLSSWKSVDPAVLRFRVEGKTATLRVIPSAFTVDGKDLKPFVPSGLLFSVEGEAVEYDFRVKSGPYFLRFNGRLQTESSFLERLGRAIDDPAAFALENDPDYLSRRIAELQEALEASDAKIAGLESALAERDERMKAAVAASDASDAETAAAVASLRRAAMAVYSKGLFGAPKPIPDEIVAGIAALRAERPSIAADELAAALKEKGIAASSKQINAVLAVIYGE